MNSEALQSFFESVLGQIATVAVIFLLLAVIMKLSGKKNSVSVMVKTAILIGITFVLNRLTVIRMPQGGSLTVFGMLALFMVSYLFGARQGILAGMAYGLLDLLINPSVIHPVQLFLDYPLAFGAIGIGGLLRNTKNGVISGYIIGVFCRYAVVTISGMIFWGMYAAEGFNEITWSLFYNMTYILPEAVVTVVVLMIPQIRKFFDKFKLQD